MTEQERAELIRLDGLAHEARHLKRRKAREASDQRKRDRGLAAAIARLSPNESRPD